MKTQIIVSSKAFQEWIIDVWNDVSAEDILFQIKSDKIFSGTSIYFANNQKGAGEYYIGSDSVERLINVLEIIPIQPVKLIFEDARISIECQF